MLDEDNFQRIDQLIAKQLKKFASEHIFGQQLNYTRAQSAAILGVSTSTLDVLISRGEIRVKHWGTKRLIPHDELVRVAKKDFRSIWPEKVDNKTSRTDEGAA